MMFGVLSSYDKRSQSLMDRSNRYSKTIQQPQQNSLSQKVNKIALMNLKEHDLDICACQECIYSRQLNRKHKITLDMSKNSSYRSQFDCRPKKNNQQDFKINYQAIQNSKIHKSAVVDHSSYGSNYNKDNPYEKPQKAHPQDQLRFIGPTKSLSSYGEQYPAFKNNANPYVKPTQVTVPNTLKMNLKSVYQSNYNGTLQPATQTGKIADHLHVGLPWTGGSTYRQLFKGQVSKGISVRENSSSSNRVNNLQDSNYAHQYQTTYRNQYLLQGRKKCNRGEIAGDNPLLQALKQSLQL